MTNNNRDLVLNIIKSIANSSSINMDERLVSSEDLFGDGFLDSLNLVCLIGDLEEEFNIEFHKAHIRVDSFKTLNSIIGLLDEYL